MAHKGSYLDVQNMATIAMDYLSEFKVENKKLHQRCQSRCIACQPPLLGTFKLNIDAATFEDFHALGIGAVVRDYSGFVLGAMALKSFSASNAAIVEGWAIYYGVTFARDAGFKSVIVESNAAVIVTALNSTIPYMT